MGVIRKCEIRVGVQDRSRIVHFDLSRSRFDGDDDLFGLFLKGSMETGAVKPKRLEIRYLNRRLDRIKVAASKLKGQGGFELGLSLLGGPTMGNIEVAAVFGPGDAVKVAEIHVERERLETGYASAIAPLILSSMGRSGTTWFMHLLGKHPAIYVHDEYPHELLGAYYWVNMLESLTTPLAADRIMSKWKMRDHAVKSVRTHVYYRRGAPDPVLKYLGGAYVRELAAFCQQSIDHFYQGLGRAKSAATGARLRYFSEKSLPFPALIREIYVAAKEVFLIRDVRDNICSALAFNAKRGTQDFGREAAESDAGFAAYRCAEFKGLYQAYLASTSTALLVKYEDLIADPAATIRNVLDYLGLEGSPATIAMMQSQAEKSDGNLDYHRTSASPVHSVQRWRRELPQALAQKCMDLAGDELRALQYQD
ncbi:MAG: sulfotransferase [Gammaproteobacteria bacterium]|nr:sulfotransferase [Gammaproteobacteria bacterium]